MWVGSPWRARLTGWTFSGPNGPSTGTWVSTPISSARWKSGNCPPITNTDGVIGGLYDPLDGHLDPSGTTHAYARAARNNGAEIILRNPVTALNPRPDGGWEVVTDQGSMIAEHVVNAAGLWAREVGAMAGVYLPLHPMEHQYLATDTIEEVVNHGSELPHVMDPEGESYLRQERDGLVIGFYEQDCDPWAVDGTSWNFGHELLPDNLDRIGDALAMAYRRYPVLEKAGIKTVINGPFTFAPRRESAGGPGAGTAEFLVRLRGHGGIQPRRRRRSCARGMDGRGRALP